MRGDDDDGDQQNPEQRPEGHALEDSTDLAAVLLITEIGLYTSQERVLVQGPLSAISGWRGTPPDGLPYGEPVGKPKLLRRSGFRHGCSLLFGLWCRGRPFVSD